MHIAVGYSEHPDSDIAGANAIMRALNRAGRSDPCDIVLLFATSQHEPRLLLGGLRGVVGDKTPVIGGNAVGIITNDRFGYAGEQVGVAAIWLEGIGLDLASKGGLVNNEYGLGLALGRNLADAGYKPDTPCMLFYDAIDRADGEMRLNLATPLMEGIEAGLGFLPSKLVGAGLQGDYQGSQGVQFIGRRMSSQCAMLLSFSGGLEIESVIMHGCRPYGDIYTVTKAEGQTILEVNGQPALPFVQSRVKPALSAEEFPFFMIFGVNRDPGSEYHEELYANRLCLAIDKPRNGIVMFESDMVAGTKFQLMYRSLDLKYIPPKIDALLERKPGRRPVFAFYINCAGRAARYGGELEDAEVVQRAVADRVPLLGIYSGVEIAPIMGKPRTLDWTGVFCLFSVPAGGAGAK